MKERQERKSPRAGEVGGRGRRGRTEERRGVNRSSGERDVDNPEWQKGEKEVEVEVQD